MSCRQAAASSARSSEKASTSARCAPPVMRRLAAAELGGDEVELVAVALQLGADDLDAAAGAGADRVEQLLAADAPGVPQHEVGVVGRRLEVGERLVEERVGHLLDALDADEPRLAEQGRAREGDELARRVGAGVEVGDLERRILGLQDVAQQPHRPLGEHGLGAGDQHDRRRAGLVPGQLRDGGLRRARAAPRGCRHGRSSRRSHTIAAVQTLDLARRALRSGATRTRPSRSVRVGRRAGRREDAEQLVGRMAVVVVGADPDEADRRVAAPRRAPPTGRRSRGARPSRRRPGRGAQPRAAATCDSSPRSPRRTPLRHPRRTRPPGARRARCSPRCRARRRAAAARPPPSDSSPSMPRSPVDTWSTSAPAARERRRRSARRRRPRRADQRRGRRDRATASTPPTWSRS